jgi:hypothetical protein
LTVTVSGASLPMTKTLPLAVNVPVTVPDRRKVLSATAVSVIGPPVLSAVMNRLPPSSRTVERTQRSSSSSTHKRTGRPCMARTSLEREGRSPSPLGPGARADSVEETLPTISLRFVKIDKLGKMGSVQCLVVPCGRVAGRHAGGDTPALRGKS